MGEVSVRQFGWLTAVLVGSMGAAWGQVASGPPKFAVVSVKASAKDANGYVYRLTADGVTERNNTALWLLTVAYGVARQDRVLGAPKWADEERFDVEAKVDDGDVAKLVGMKPEERNAMLVRVLEERFGLKAHAEMREFPGFELVVAKGGVKPGALTPNDPAVKAPGWRYNGRYNLTATGTSMHDFAQGVLSSEVPDEVSDATGIVGKYDFLLSWTREDMNAVPVDGAGPSIYTALKEQLGLTLVKARLQRKVLVVERMERPGGN